MNATAEERDDVGSQIATAVGEPRDWLAMLLLKCAVDLANGIRRRLDLKRGEKCPRCGNTF